MNARTLYKPVITENPFVQHDEATYHFCLEEVDKRLISENIGYLGPDSVSWKIFREPCILLGGFRAIMLQMAHPAIAQGVEQSSSFRYDVVGRARRTMTAMYSLIFGSRATALKASRMMFSIHHRVFGEVPDHYEGDWAGNVFRANDPNLLDWVGLTTLDSVLCLFESLVRPLTAEERQQFAYEAQTVALLCGLPPEFHRDSIEEFGLSPDTMFDSFQLAIGPIAEGIVEDLFNAVPGSLNDRLTAGFLPQAARELYQIEWTEELYCAFDKLKRRIALVNQGLPATLRYAPAYRKALSRVSKTQLGEAVGKGEEKTNDYYMTQFGFGGDSSANKPDPILFV